MSAFCVFGVTINDCIEKAKKKVPLKSRELKRTLTRDEWLVKVDALAKEYFSAGKFSKQISPAFDAPQFANDWIEVAKRTIESHSIKLMARGPKIDDKGGPVLRKGVPVIGWTPYNQNQPK